jgi:predicted nucleic acid-binding protein
MANRERILLNTDIVMHLLKKRPEIVSHFIELREQEVEILLSPIVVAEIYAGAFDREYPVIEAFFSLCRRLTLESDTARTAGRYANRYRKAYQGVSLEDCLLAATARAFHCPLWTGNRQHYPMDDIELYGVTE